MEKLRLARGLRSAGKHHQLEINWSGCVAGQSVHVDNSRLTLHFYRFAPYLFLLPSVRIWRRLNSDLWIRWGGNSYLSELLEPLEKRFDFIILDCPPSLGLLTLNALCAAKEIAYCRSSASSLPWKASSSCCKPMNRSSLAQSSSWGFSAWC